MHGKPTTKILLRVDITKKKRLQMIELKIMRDILLL